jgi:hypothetical protein
MHFAKDNQLSLRSVPEMIVGFFMFKLLQGVAVLTLVSTVFVQSLLSPSWKALKGIIVTIVETEIVDLSNLFFMSFIFIIFYSPSSPLLNLQH